MDPSPAGKTTVENHAVTVMSSYTSDQDVFFHSGSVGLGTSSTLLTDLVNSGKIGRRVVGLYLGTAYPRAGGVVNGSVVLGGYDAGRLASEPHEYSIVAAPAADASPFKVRVKQLSLTTRNNDSIGLITDDGFDGYISTSKYAMDLPDTVLQRLSSALLAKSTNDAENVLRLDRPFDGNLTITLEDGYQITYPSEWISNISGRTPFSAPASNSSKANDAPLVLGAAFLHHLYMAIDYDANKFALSNAKLANNYAMPTSLCPGTLPLQVGSSEVNKFLRSGMIGVILGAIIGGLGLLFCIYFFTRKHLQHKAAKQRLEGRASSAATIPKKSSLRTRTKRGLVRFARTKDVKDLEAANSKRVSFTDSDTSPEKAITITVMDKGIRDTPGIEMQHFGKAHSERSDSRMSDADTLHEVPLTFHDGRTRQTMLDLPNPDRFTNPYAVTPGQTGTPAETPRTGNPLLGNYRGFMNYADDDDSDIHPTQPQGHRRTPSESMIRNEMGLKIDTSVTPGRRAQEVTGKKKPAPLPLRVNRPTARAKTESDYVKSNPVRALFGKSQPTKSSALRRMFPSDS